MGRGRPEIHTFCLDDNYGWDDGLICGGRMRILADPLPAAIADVPAGGAGYFRRFRDFVEQGTGCTEAVVLEDGVSGHAAGTRFLFNAAGELAARRAGDPGDPGDRSPLPPAVGKHLVPLGHRPRPSSHGGIAYLPVLPRVTLLIVGGGHVGCAVAQLAATVDFDIWVLDDRERYASRERFPTAERLLVGDIGATLKALVRRDITSSTFCIIVTRGHAHDEEALYHMATSAAGYVGMIGSKRKKKLIYEDLLAAGIPQEALARVRSPLGFDIGSQTVPEIAVSIVAELIAWRNLPKSP
jgi:xanthine dehydrogenase accessory factor